MTVRSNQVADFLGYRPDLIAFRTLHPPILDMFHLGWSLAAVLVASVAFPRALVQGVAPFVLVLDQRPLLMEVEWRLLQAPLVYVQDLADEYGGVCPDGYSVAFTGAATEEGPSGPAFRVSGCTCLTVDFVVIWRLGSDEDSSGSDDGQSLSSSMPDETSLPPSAPADSEASDSQEGGPPERPAGAPLAASPRYRVSDVSADFAALAPPSGIPDWGPAGSRVAMCGDSLLQDAIRHGSCPCTSFLLPAYSARAGLSHAILGARAAFSVAPFWRLPATVCAPTGYVCLGKVLPAFGHGLHCLSAACSAVIAGGCLTLRPGDMRQCKLYREPASDSRRSALLLQAARVGTVRLGIPWNLAQQDAQWELEEPGPEPHSPAASDSSGPVSFLVLTPDYRPERLTVCLEVPAAVSYALQQLQRKRSALRGQDFPVLVPAWPQPDERWAVVLALPRLVVADCRVVCLDLWDYDGRVFAVLLPSCATLQEILEAAALPAEALVDVFMSNHPHPLQDGAVIRIETGMTFSFVLHTRRAPVLYSLGGLLESHLPWSAGPAFPYAPEVKGTGTACGAYKPHACFSCSQAARSPTGLISPKRWASLSLGSALHQVSQDLWTRPFKDAHVAQL